MKIRLKIFIAVTSILIAVNIIFSIYLVGNKQSEEKERLENKIERTNSLIKLTSVNLLWDVDKEKLEDNLLSFVKDPEIINIYIKDNTEVIKLFVGEEAPENSAQLIKQDFIIEKDRKILADVQITYTSSLLDRQIKHRVTEMLILTIGLIILYMIVIYLISKYLLLPVDAIVDGMHKVDQGNYNFVLSLNTKDEFKLLESGFNKMLKTINKDIDFRKHNEEVLYRNNEILKNEINEREKAETALAKSEELYRLMADNANDIIAQLSSDGIFLYMSSASESLLGYKPEELVGTNSFFLVYKDDFESLQKAHRELLETQEPNSIIYRLRHKNGNYIWFETNNKIMHSAETGKTKITCVTRNISERKKYEEELKQAKQRAEESDLLKSTFLANMSHEIRTPMNGILGFTELLKKPGIPPKKQQEFIEIINKSSHSLLNIINDIMDISKIEANQINIIDRESNINTLLSDLDSFYKTYKAAKNKEEVELIYKKGLDDQQANIFVDIDRLRQVISNLLSNSIKFTQEGKIEFGYERKDSQTLLFHVSDTGIGISPSKINLVFERFRQADDSLTRQYGGTGLGLPISKGLIELMGGKMWAESEIGAGSTFFFTIPYKPIVVVSNIVSSDNPDNEQSEQENSADSLWQKKTILIAEDDVTSYMFLEEILSNTGLNIIFAKDGKEAVEMCKNNPEIELVLMDMQMPVINGYDATRQIKKIRDTLPIIAQTAHALVDDKKKCLDAGCDDYIKKPIDFDSLIKKIKEYID